MEKIKIILLLILFPLIVFSQENTIQGKVTAGTIVYVGWF